MIIFQRIYARMKRIVRIDLSSKAFNRTFFQCSLLTADDTRDVHQRGKAFDPTSSSPSSRLVSVSSHCMKAYLLSYGDSYVNVYIRPTWIVLHRDEMSYAFYF